MTPSGKVEFYSNRFESMDASPLPVFTAPAGEPLDRKNLSAAGFPLLGQPDGRPSLFTQS